MTACDRNCCGEGLGEEEEHTEIEERFKAEASAGEKPQKDGRRQTDGRYLRKRKAAHHRRKKSTE